MKTIIAGSRTIKSMALVEQAIAESGFVITEVVSGRARGVDRLGEMWARRQRPRIPIKPFPADWDRFPHTAAYLRNQEMVDYAEALIAVWKAGSNGTADMICRARLARLYVHILKV